MPFDVSYWPIVGAAVAQIVLGMVWYSPSVFGKMWMQLMGYTESDMAKAKEAGMGSSYALMALGALVMSYVLAYFVQSVGAATATAGAQVGFWAWLGFVAVVLLSSVLWERKSWNLFYVNAGYWLATLLLGGAIVAHWS